MRILGFNGQVGEFLQFMHFNATTFAIVKLSDGSLVEWNISYCRVVEERKTSELVESAPSASNNTDYAAALRVRKEFISFVDGNVALANFDDWLQQRLNSAKSPNCA